MRNSEHMQIIGVLVISTGRSFSFFSINTNVFVYFEDFSLGKLYLLFSRRRASLAQCIETFSFKKVRIRRTDLVLFLQLT
jgi:hypothetical protein